MNKRKKKFAGEIGFVFNGEKSIHVILYIIQQCKGKINQYNLLKVIFEADKYHLNKHGIPVTGDIYRNMSFGTVPVAIYNTIKGKKSPKKDLEEMGMKRLPYKYNKDTHMLTSSVPPDHDHFIETDVEALDHSIRKYGTMNIEELRQENHKERCWLETERRDLVPFELMIENKQVLDALNEDPYGIVV